MPRTSAGLLVYRRRPESLEVLLVHPGGPLWAKKDAGAWTIPKGEFTTEEPLAAARREFTEETGQAPAGPFIDLGTVRQAGGKIVHGFAAEADFDADAIVSTTFQLEWPPRSGKIVEFPEVDRAGWFSVEAATSRINPAQADFLTRLEQRFNR